MLGMFSALCQLRVGRASVPCVRYTSRSARSILNDDDMPVDLSEDNDAVDGVRAKRNPKPATQQRTPSEWRTHRAALKESFPQGWDPPRKLSREAMEGLRQLHRVDPTTFTTPVLAERFRVSPEAVRRILKSRWEPPVERKKKLVRKAAEERAKVLSLREVRERVEAQRVMQSRMYGRAARQGDGLELDGEDEPSHRGIHARDRLTFE
ncbi:putative neugrin-like protein [Mycena sanguinolenta]|uniref:Required for respiratory growth protein 9, mitochondrial n=1 Tax=Mycena sanguinolenta TaxID=230812 RepID=A0A8H6XT28_9AGAR|nr:putative neugrin-like protein [Mycena sanguinolenta]